MRDVVDASKNTAGTAAQKAEAMKPLLDEINKANPAINAEPFSHQYGAGFAGEQGEFIMAGSDGVTYAGKITGQPLIDLITGAKPPSQIPGVNPAR